MPILNSLVAGLSFFYVSCWWPCPSLFWFGTW